MVSHSACKDVFTGSGGVPSINSSKGCWCKDLDPGSNPHQGAGGGWDGSHVVPALPSERDAVTHSDLERGVLMTGLNRRAQKENRCLEEK